MPEDNNTTPVTDPNKVFNWGINNKVDEKNFKRLSETEKVSWLESLALTQFFINDDIRPFTEFRSKTGDTLEKDALEKEVNSIAKQIEERARADPIAFFERIGEVIIIEDKKPVESYWNVLTAGDPVNLFDGNFTYSNTDFSIIGCGMDFVFTRTYSNQTFYLGTLGHKWDHNYNLRLRVTPDFNLIYRSTDMASESLYRRHNIHGYWLAEGGEDGIITCAASTHGRHFSFLT